MIDLIFDIIFSFVNPPILVGFISFNNEFPIQDFIDHKLPSGFNLVSSNNCNRKLSWTFGLAITIIRCLIPIDFI